jgi:hypothetical protein
LIIVNAGAARLGLVGVAVGQRQDELMPASQKG